ncbi:D-alanine--D-alanine ligase [Verticiella sediminum]|uniref:D-alanine--D-alanine ligase n=2 Tax=Verticiella sediminum TaxID=1247510 RepID=A0A556A8F8_9BURK|nr:D-alanine--D-alanine ligase [Verticiella sediminum]
MGRVGVLYGGSSAEREVSLMSGAGVHSALREAGVDAHLFDTGKEGIAALAGAGFDRVFIALHGRWGEDGCIQGALELLGIPYTGSGVAACALAMDKVMTKRVWLQHKLPTPRFAVLRAGESLEAVPGEVGLPLIVKPAHEGSTLGLTKVCTPASLAGAYELAARYDTAVLAEEFIAGRELTVAVLGSDETARVLPVIEILAPDGNYDFQNKYYSDDTRYVCPAQLSESVTRQVQALAVAAYRAVGCAGWGRVDVMLDREHRPYLLEVNTAPGMTGHSLVPMAAAAAGMSYSELCVEILASARCKLQPHSVPMT